MIPFTSKQSREFIARIHELIRLHSDTFDDFFKDIRPTAAAFPLPEENGTLEDYFSKPFDFTMVSKPVASPEVIIEEVGIRFPKLRSSYMHEPRSEPVPVTSSINLTILKKHKSSYANRTLQK